MSRTMIICFLLVAFALHATSESAAKDRVASVRIDLSGAPSGGNPAGGAGTFRLRSGTIRDRGTFAYSFALSEGRPDASGRTPTAVEGSVYLTGAHDSAEIRIDAVGYVVAGEGAVQGRDIWIGTWTEISGSGPYAHVRKGSVVGIVGPGVRIVLRLTGRAVLP